MGGDDTCMVDNAAEVWHSYTYSISDASYQSISSYSATYIPFRAVDHYWLYCRTTRNEGSVDIMWLFSSARAYITVHAESRWWVQFYFSTSRSVLLCAGSCTFPAYCKRIALFDRPPSAFLSIYSAPTAMSRGSKKRKATGEIVICYTFAC